MSVVTTSIGLLIAGLFALLPLSVAAQGAAAGNVQVVIIPSITVTGTPTYTAHMLCGTVFSDRDLVQFPERSVESLLVPGTYLTTFNLYNPYTSIFTLRLHLNLVGGDSVLARVS